MSKIAQYREQRRVTTKIIGDLNQCQGLTRVGNEDPNNDKHTFEFTKQRIWDTDIPVWLHASYGYYGNSAGYSACSPDLQRYLIQALQHYRKDIINYIVEAVKHDEHKALLECKSEAEQILKEIDSAMISEV